MEKLMAYDSNRKRPSFKTTDLKSQTTKSNPLNERSGDESVRSSEDYKKRVKSAEELNDMR
jgi:hypothetical protein